ncbi:MAG: ABC transporter substrate-binding protein [Propylenella sp.]
MWIAPALAVALIAAPAAAEETLLNVSLDSELDGPLAAFVVALERGYFTDEGLVVTLNSGYSALAPIKSVASGESEMGFTDINALIKFNDQNPDAGLKAIYIVYDKPAFAIIGRKGLGVSAPKDLEGKTLGAPATDPAFEYWSAFVEATGIDASKVTIENVGTAEREAKLAEGKVQAITGLSFNEVLDLEAVGIGSVDTAVMLMGDHGLDLYGNAIFVRPAFAGANPQAVKGFVRAFNKALKDTIADPETAARILGSVDPVKRGEKEPKRLKLALEQVIVTDAVKANGLGAVDMERLARAIDQIGVGYDFANKPTPESVFDPSFLPDAAERMLGP